MFRLQSQVWHVFRVWAQGAVDSRQGHRREFSTREHMSAQSMRLLMCRLSLTAVVIPGPSWPSEVLEWAPICSQEPIVHKGAQLCVQRHQVAWSCGNLYTVKMSKHHKSSFRLLLLVFHFENWFTSNAMPLLKLSRARYFGSTPTSHGDKALCVGTERL